MISKIQSSAVLGVDAYLVEVEVDISQGLPNFMTVGLAEGAVKESKERVRSAIKNCRYDFPQRRITVHSIFLYPSEYLLLRDLLNLRPPAVI